MQVMVVSVFILVGIGVCEAGIGPAGAESEARNDDPAFKLNQRPVAVDI
jgi:hypothetical protein